ncbi:hypothetical protein GN958_ATG16863 [Phytophthora infestans]|uniref:SWIM-type domain-containing protein n=1 Tax=Phytophthora infestans TaxID=4787 RepID=A0A8S9U516_PHYIN|nr:hypothetical protein GN958_ATG16863 [Phytophthora infestans]
MKILLRLEEKQQLWFSYFDDNWTTCKEQWSSIYRGNIPHLGNQTNNRLESSWQKLKSLVNRSTTLDECVVAILFWQTVNERSWERSINRIGVAVSSDYDEELNMLLNLISRHAVELVTQQYEFAILPTTKYQYYPVGPYIMMQYDDENKTDDILEEYMISTEAWTCSCIFRMTHLLPCRHIIYYRKETDCDRLLPKSIIHPRWLLKNYRKLKSKVTLVEDVEEAFEIRDIKTPSTTRTKSQNEKFRELQVIGKQIAEIGCQWGTTAHATLTASMVQVLEAVKAGNCPLLRQPESEHPRSTSPSLPEPDSDSQASTVLHPERGTHANNDAQSETGNQSEIDRAINTDELSFEGIGVDDNHGMQLSPTGAALLSFMEGVDADHLHPTQLAQETFPLIPRMVISLSL